MKSQSDNKETLSRRGFTKSIGLALAAIPFVSSLVEGQQKRRSGRAPAKQHTQMPRCKQDAAANLEDNRNEHDTPPPVEIINGSFIIETEKDFAIGDIMPVSGGIKRHNINPNSTLNHNRIFPAHIKVVQGSGEMYCRYNADDKNNPHLPEFIKITALLKDGTLVTIGSTPVVNNRQTFAIDVNNKRSLFPPTSAHDKPVGKKRHARRRVKRDDGRPSDTSISVLTITDTNPNLPTPQERLNVSMDDLPAGGDELRVMIWLEGKYVA